MSHNMYIERPSWFAVILWLILCIVVSNVISDEISYKIGRVRSLDQMQSLIDIISIEKNSQEAELQKYRESLPWKPPVTND